MTTPARLSLVALVFAAGPGACRADRLYLKNGQVKVGQVVKKEADFIDFRISMSGGKLMLVKRYPAADVVKIERDDETETPVPEARPAGKIRLRSRAPTTTRSSRKIEDKPDFLAKALAKIKEDKLDAAVRDLTRLVYACKDNADELAELSALCEEHADQPLDELLASNRLRVVLKKSRGRLGRLSITKYEREAMIPELREAIERNREMEAGGTTIDKEIDDPEAYDANRKDAKALARHIAQTLDLLKELKRLDPSSITKPRSGRRRRPDRADKNQDEKDRDDEHGDDEDRDGADKPSGRKARTTHRKRPDDLATFRKQLLVLYKAVQRVSRGRGRPRPETFGEDEGGFGQDERGLGPDRQRDWRRGRPPRGDRRDVGGFDERDRRRDARDRGGDRPPDDRERDERDRRERR